MHANLAEPNGFLYVVLCVGVGGSVVALLGIWLEIRWGLRARRCFSGFLFALLSFLAAILWRDGQPASVVGPVLALGAACLVACAMQVDFLRRWANRILEPRVIWTLLLVVSPIFAAVYAHNISKPEELPASLVETSLKIDTAAGGPLAVTDLGREVALFHYSVLHSLEALEDSLLEAERFTHDVIRVEGPSANCNCHGWVFTGGAFGVPGELVDTILADNGYLPADDAQAGDLVIHRDVTGVPRHTGIVRFVGDDGIVLEESKWGPLGVFLHNPETQPYGKYYDYWRSSRLGHLLDILPEGKNLPQAEMFTAQSCPDRSEIH